jgi:hypothetical protein
VLEGVKSALPNQQITELANSCLLISVLDKQYINEMYKSIRTEDKKYLFLHCKIIYFVNITTISPYHLARISA